MADKTRPVSAQQAMNAPLLSNLPPPAQIPPRFFVPEAIAAPQQQQQQQQHAEQLNTNAYQQIAAEHIHHHDQSNDAAATNTDFSQLQANRIQDLGHEQHTSAEHDVQQLSGYQQQQYYQPQQSDVNSLQYGQYHQTINNYNPNENYDEADTATNSADSYNGSLNTNSSNESNYLQGPGQYSQQQTYDSRQYQSHQPPQDQYYDHHNNI